MEELHRYTDFPISVDLDDTLRLLGYRRDKKPQTGLAKLIEESAREAEGLVRASGLFALFERKSFPEGSFLTTLFGKSDVPIVKIALAVCTIGPLVEEIVSKYSDSGHLTRGLLIDAAGSSLAETASDFVNEKICQVAANRSLYPAPRISPGYGHWKIEEQSILFDLLPTDSVGVSLTESCLMLPRKSVSFAVELLSEIPPDGPASRCKRCGRKECQFRRDV